MPIILLEGVDGSGKSTLAEYLRTTYGAKVVHLGPPSTPEAAVFECLTPLNEYSADDPDDLIVYDRAHWGCPVYGPIYRPDANRDGFGDMGRVGWRYLERFFRAKGAVMGFVDIEPDLAIERCTERGEDYINLEHVPEIVERYRELRDLTMLDCYQLTLSTENDTVRAGSKLFYAVQSAYQRSVYHLSYAGPERPDVLLVAPPMLEDRLAALADAEETWDWHKTGIISGVGNVPEVISRTIESLGYPEVIKLYDQRIVIPDSYEGSVETGVI